MSTNYSQENRGMSVDEKAQHDRNEATKGVEYAKQKTHEHAEASKQAADQGLHSTTKNLDETKARLGGDKNGGEQDKSIMQKTKEAVGEGMQKTKEFFTGTDKDKEEEARKKAEHHGQKAEDYAQLSQEHAAHHRKE